MFMSGRYKAQIRVSLIISSIFLFSTVLAATIIIASGHATLTLPGVPQNLVGRYVDQSGFNLNYNGITLGKAFVVTGWISVLLTITSTVLVWRTTTEWTGENLHNSPSHTSVGNMDEERNLKMKDEVFEARLARAS